MNRIWEGTMFIQMLLGLFSFGIGWMIGPIFLMAGAMFLNIPFMLLGCYLIINLYVCFRSEEGPIFTLLFMAMLIFFPIVFAVTEGVWK